MPLGFPSFTANKATTFITISSYYCIFTLIILQQISALQCPPGIQYWNSELDSCINCTKCSELSPKGYLIVLRRCQVHRDTHCGPISKLRSLYNAEIADTVAIESTTPVVHRRHNHQFITGENDDHNESTPQEMFTPQQHRRRRLNKHHHRKHYRNKHKHEMDDDQRIWKFANNSVHSEYRGHNHRPIISSSTTSSSSSLSSSDSNMNENSDENSAAISSVAGDLLVNQKLVWTQQNGVAIDQTPFTNVETLIWDWQAIVLAMAVCACILFFVVAAVYSVHHARQWKRLKDNFEADVEELSARLNLMVASGDIGDNLEPNFHSPINDGNYHNNRCVYLEQLLVRKDTKLEPKRGVGNVYIEEKNGSNNGGSIINTTSSTEKKTND